MVYQLPPETVTFVDREPEQATALRAVAEWRQEHRPLVVAVSGIGGIGKTELAHRLGRTLFGGHSEEVFSLDLADLRKDGGVDEADALGALLGSLKAVPDGPSLDQRRRQYWELTRQRRLVLLLDNAVHGSEVLPLLPAGGGSVVIVTSHGPLYHLGNAVAVDLPLGPLPAEDALRLLRGDGDDPRLAAEPEAASELLRLCGGLPAALDVAARWLRRHHRRSLRRLLAELRADLDENGVDTVEQVWDAAYDDLAPEAARLYRLLAAAPACSLAPEAVTALLGAGPDAAEDAREELERAGLLDRRDPRVFLPELLLAHAQRRARRHGDPREAAAGRERLVRWLLRQAQRADLLAAGDRLRIAAIAPALDGAPDVSFPDVSPPGGAEGRRDGPGAGASSVAGAGAGAGAGTGAGGSVGSGGGTDDGPKHRALRWLETERRALYGCVALAHAHGGALDDAAWALCEPLFTHFLDHPHHADAIDAFRLGRDAAQRAGQVAALVRMRCQLARPLWELGEFDAAERELEQARTAADALPDDEDRKHRKLAASAREFHGQLRGARGDWAAAAADFAAAREVHRAIENAYGETLQTYRLGEAWAALGELERAEAELTRAHAGMAELGRVRMTARTGFALGRVLHRLGRGAEAWPLYDAALASAQDRGAPLEEARVRDAWAALAADLADEAVAEEHRRAAAEIRRRNGLSAPGEPGAGGERRGGQG